MKSERESMTIEWRWTLRPWGVEERSDEAPRAGASDDAGAVGPGGGGQAEAAPVHSGVSAADPRGGRALHAARRSGSAASPRGAVQLPSDGLAQGAASRVRFGSLTPKQARSRSRVERNPLEREGARARGESGAAGEGVAHRPYDPGRPGKSCRAAGIQPRTRERDCLMAVPNRSHRRSAWRRRAERWGCHGLPSTVVRGPLPGISSPVLRPPGPCAKSERAHDPRRARQPALRRPCRRPRSSRRCSMRASICAPSARCTGSWLPNQPVRERRNQLEPSPATPSPSSWPRGPTRPGPGTSPGSVGAHQRWTSFYLYVLLDIFSRYVGGLDGCRPGERRARRDV